MLHQLPNAAAFTDHVEVEFPQELEHLLVLAADVPHAELFERLLTVVLPRVDRDRNVTRVGLDVEVPLVLNLVLCPTEQGFTEFELLKSL